MDFREKKTLLYSTQDGRCYGCGEVFAIDDLQIDHILPKHRLGKARKRNPWFIDELFNLRLLCASCHLMKRPRGFTHDDEERINEDIAAQVFDAKWIDDLKLREHYKRTLLLYKIRERWFR